MHNSTIHQKICTQNDIRGDQIKNKIKKFKTKTANRVLLTKRKIKFKKKRIYFC